MTIILTTAEGGVTSVNTTQRKCNELDKLNPKVTDHV